MSDVCTCDHHQDSHRYEPGFYDVRGFDGECQVVGCPCSRFKPQYRSPIDGAEVIHARQQRSVKALCGSNVGPISLSDDWARVSCVRCLKWAPQEAR